MQDLKERTSRQMLAQMSGAQVAAVLDGLRGVSQRDISIRLSRGGVEERPLRMAITAARFIGHRPPSDIVNVICWPTDDGGERIVVNLRG
jgi:hypothetical protein